MNRTLRNLGVALLAVAALAASSCSDEGFVMDSSFIKTNTFAVFTDQMPIKLSTFRLDSVQTSGQNRAWVGQCRKKIIGDIHSESYLKLAEPTYGWLSREQYDSITVTLRHTGEYEGDTTKELSIDIRRLAQPLRFAENESAFFNVRSFRDSTSIGSFTVRPRPHNNPRLFYRINDDFGLELVEFIKKNQTQNPLVAKQNFENYLGGIKLTYTGKPEAMVAFRADSCYITLHSHLRAMKAYRVERRLYLTRPDMQFNHLWNDNIEAPYDTLQRRYDKVVETDGGNHSVIFEGLGYYPRVDLPTLDQIASVCNDAHIVKARVKLYAERGSYDRRNFPNHLYLSEVNLGNSIGNNIANSRGEMVVAFLRNNNLDEDHVYYEADITYYLNTLIARNYIEPGAGVAFTWNQSMLPTDYNFMIFNGHSKERFKSKLEIHYYNYDKEER